MKYASICRQHQGVALILGVLLLAGPVVALPPKAIASPTPRVSPTSTPTPARPAIPATPRQVVEDFYKWIFQVKVPEPWQEVVRQRRDLLTDALAAILNERSLRQGFDFEPFLDSDGKASGFRVLNSEQRGKLAMVSLWIQGASTGIASHDRMVVVELQDGPGGWKIANFHYQWAEPEDLLSICRRHKH